MTGTKLKGNNVFALGVSNFHFGSDDMVGKILTGMKNGLGVENIAGKLGALVNSD